MQSGGRYRLHFWQVLQISHYFRSLVTPANFRRQRTTFESYCEDKDPLPRNLFKMYALLIIPQDDFLMPDLNKWDLNRIFTTAQRQNIIHLSLKSSICTRIQKSHYKLTCWHRTPSVLHRFYPEASERCWRCRKGQGTIFHIFWLCSKIKRYWSEDFSKISLLPAHKF